MMAQFSLTHLPTGRDLGLVEAHTGPEAVARYLAKHPDSGMRAEEIAVSGAGDDERVARLVISHTDGVLAAMQAGADGRLPGHCVVAEARGAVLALVLEGEEIASFTLIDPEGGTGRGAGLLFGCFSLKSAVNFALLLCCSSENLAGCPEAYFGGGVFLPPARLTELRMTLSVVDGFTAAWSRSRRPLWDITRE